MNRVLDPIARLGMALWIGAVAAIAFLVAPRVFGYLDDNEKAGELMRRIFEMTDLFGVCAAAVFTFAARHRKFRAILAAVVGACAAVNRFGVTPRIVARPPDMELWHRISEGLWGVILIGGVLLVMMGPGGPKKDR